MNFPEIKTIVWAALEIGLIPTISVVLILYFLRHIRELQTQNEKLVQDLRTMNEKTLEMIRDLVDLRLHKS
jgi:hypothetical protein